MKAPTFTGNFAQSGAVTLNADSIVDYASTSVSQTISSAFTYSTLRISGSGTKSLAANLPALRNTAASTGNILVESGTLDLGAFTADRTAGGSAGGTLSVANGAVLKLGGTLTMPANYVTRSFGEASTVEYYGTAQTVSFVNYGHLTLGSSSGAVTKTMPSSAMTIRGNLSAQLNGGTSLTFSAGNSITVKGDVLLGSGTTFNGGSFAHTFGEDWTNNGTYNGNTGSATFTGTGSILSGAGNNNFNNLTLTGSGITAATATSLSVAGQFATSGAGTFTHLPGGAGTLTMTGATRTISGNDIFLNNLSVTGSVSSASTLTVAGNLSVGGSLTSTGNITMTGAGRSISGAGALVFKTLVVNGSVTTARSFAVNGDLSVSAAGSLTGTAGTVTFSGNSIFSGAANLFNATLNGTRLQLASGAALGVGGALALTAGTFDVTTTVPNTLIYNAAGSQTVIGTTYHHLTISGSGTNTAGAAFTANGNLSISSGATLSAGTFTHSVFGSFINGGSFVAGSGTVQLRGFADSSVFGPTTFNILTVSKNSSANVVTLGANVTAATVNMTTGILNTVTNTLTITTTRTGTGYIFGTITRSHSFAAGVPYAFEGPDNTITFSSVSGLSSLTVSIAPGTVVAGFPFSAAVNRAYSISQNSGAVYVATLRLHYADAELNGNDEDSMKLWQYGGSQWLDRLKSGNNSTANWLEQSGLSSLSGSWAISDSVNVVRWNGSVSSAWENANNWTVVQGAASRPPGTNDIAELGFNTFIHQPAIASPVQVRALNFGSMQPVTLALSSGSLTANIVGEWTNNATHMIDVGAQTLNVAGGLALSDGTNRVIHLAANGGSIAIADFLAQSGGANITLNGSSTLSIGGNFLHSGGTFSPGNSTVIYNGSGAQSVAGVSYNHLSFQKTGGTATLATPATAAGNLTVGGAGTFLVNNSLTASNVVINAGATLDSASSTITVTGDWIRSGVFFPGTGTVICNGAAAQSIDASTFNNLTVQKTGGAASLAGNAVLNGNLTVASGTLNLGTFSANRSALGGTLALNSNAVLQVGGGFPANFGARAFATSSTVEYNGAAPQTVAAETYGSLVISGGGANAKTLVGATSVASDLLVGPNATFGGSAFSLAVSGNWTNQGTFTPGTGTVTLAGSGKNVSGTNTFRNLTVSGSYTASGNLTVNGISSITGLLDASMTASTFAGDFLNAGSFASSGNVTFSGTAAQVIALNAGFVSTGTVRFDGNVAPSFSGGTLPSFGNIIVNNTAGISPVAGWRVNGDFTVAAGASFAGTAVTHTFYGSFINNGTVNGSATFQFAPSNSVTVQLTGTSFDSSGTVVFGGTGQISLTGGSPSFRAVTIANPQGITASANWAVSGAFSVNSAAAFNAGSFTHTLSENLTANGTFNGGSSVVLLNGNTEISGAGSTLFNHMHVSGTVAAISDFSISGNFTNNGTFSSVGAEMTFSGSSPAFIAGTTTPTPISALTVDKPGSTLTLAVNLSTVSKLSIVSGTLDIGGLSIAQDAAGGAQAISAGGTLKIGGTSTLPTFSSYNFNPASTVEYGGNGSQTIAARNYGNLASSSTGARVLASSGVIGVAGTFTPGSNSYTVTGSTISYNGAGMQTIAAFSYNHLSSSSSGGRVLPESGTIGIAGTFAPGSNSYATTNSTVQFLGGAQTIPVFPYFNVTTSGSGTKTLAGNTTVSGRLSSMAGSTADVGFVLAVRGDVNNDVAYSGTGKVLLSGTVTNQVLSGAGTFNNLELDNPNGALLSTTQLTVNGVLTLTTGAITTSTNRVIIGSTGNIVRGTGYVNGNLQKRVTTGANVFRTFEVGTLSGYNQVSVTFSNVTTAGNLTASATAGDHPSINSSLLMPARSVNSYWSLSRDGTLAFNAFNSTFQFNNPADLDPGANPANFVVARFLTNNWAYFQTNGINLLRTSTNTTALNITALGDFVVAQSTNRAPTISSMATLTGALEDTPFTIPFSLLSSNSNIADVDGDFVSFRIEAINSGTLTKDGSAVVPGVTTVSTNETLSWTPDANANGILTAFTVRAYDGTDFSTNSVVVPVNVSAVNDPPSFTRGADITVLEDAGPQVFANWASSIIAGPANESGQLVSFTTSNNNNALFSAPPSVSSNGTLTFTPAPNANGVASITLYLGDNGGIANGGIDTSASQTFTITVVPVNDAPSFVKGTNVTVRTIGGHAIPNWATAISAGPANEFGQALTFVLSNDNNAIFSVQPALSSNGQLTFTALTNGTANLTILLQDNGGTALGGVDTTAPETFTISVIAANYSPSFIPGSNQVVLEDAGPQTLANWASDLSPGAPDESWQALTFSVTNDNPALFLTEPAVSSDGTLTYTAATNAFGVAAVTVVLQDNGGTDFGGVDTSAPQTFTISVLPVNDAPLFTRGSNITLSSSSARRKIIPNWATNMTAGPANESGQALAFVVTNDVPGTFAEQPTITPDGFLSFEVAADSYNFVANVSVRLRDDGGTANGGIDNSAEQVFRISFYTFTAPQTNYAVGNRPTGLWLGNLRGRATWRDLIVANSGSNTITVRLCNDDGTFGPGTNYVVGQQPFGVRSASLRNDGFEDVVVANFGTNTVSVLMNHRTIRGRLLAATNYVVGATPNPGPIAVTLSDVNRNGRVDIAVANQTENSVSILPGLGAGQFGAPVNYPVGLAPTSIVASDLDNDGYPELLTANKGDGTLSLLRSTGTGTFLPAETIVLGPGQNPEPVHALVGNLNEGDIKDIVVANFAANTVSILLGQTNGTYQLLTNYPVGLNPRSILLRDLNLDGILDIAVACYGSATVDILLGNGDGTFQPAGSLNTGANPMTVVGSNFNSDALTDLAVSSSGSDEVIILLNASPRSYNEAVTTLENAPLDIQLRASALNATAFGFLITEMPTNGFLTGTGPHFVYQPDPNYFGLDTFKYRATANGMTSTVAVVKIAVLPVNQPPAFTLTGQLVEVTEDSPLRTVPGFVTQISRGPANEAGQTVSFRTASSVSGFFSVTPSISPDGTLTFTPARGATGDAVVSVRAVDNGGTSNGGSNTSLEQTFIVRVVPNRVKAAAGLYTGLFHEIDEARMESAGSFVIKSTAAGAFSGKITTDGAAYGFSQAFDASGLAQVMIPRANKPALLLTLQLDLAPGGDQISGTVSTAQWTAVLSGDRLVYNAKTNPASQMGRYTMVLTGSGDSVYAPGGDTVATMLVGAGGRVIVRGQTADGQRLSNKTFLSRNGHWPLHIQLYRGTGMMLSWITITGGTTNSLAGNAVWIKQPGLTNSYPNGFTNELQVIGSTYAIPASGSRAIQLTNAVIELRYGNLLAPITQSIFYDSDNRITASDVSTGMVLSVNTASGLVSGSLIHPLSGQRTKIWSVLLPQTREGRGSFMGPNQSGSLRITAAP